VAISTVTVPPPPAPTGGGGTGVDARPRHGRLALGLLAAVLLLGLTVAASFAFGTRSVPAGQLWDAVWHFDPRDFDHIVVRERIPRTVAGLLVGAALGLAGAVMQGVTRNPLADPGLLGVNAGAALAVVLGIYVFGVGSPSRYLWFAFLGAAVVSVLVYAVGSLGRDGATPVKLALAGAAVTAALGSITTAILVSDVETFDQYRFWSVGSLSNRGYDVLLAALPFIVVGCLIALGTGRMLNALSLGEDVARSLGQHVGLARGVSAVAVVLLCGAATAAAGPIGFVGLTVPHVARLITGPDYRWVLPYSMVLAPVLLLMADVIGRVIDRPGEIQAGIVTAVIGAPFFIALVRRRKLAEL
jgi:iron complex transport system permease protein